MRTEMMMAQSAPSPVAPRPEQQLAYEHVVTVELSRDLLPRRMREVQDACASNKTSRAHCSTFPCTATSSAERNHSGARGPAAVETLIAMATKDGELTARNTHAEDLAEPVADTERQLALFDDHRDRLTELMKNKDIKIEQLIVVSKELALRAIAAGCALHAEGQPSSSHRHGAADDQHATAAARLRFRADARARCVPCLRQQHSPAPSRT